MHLAQDGPSEFVNSLHSTNQACSHGQVRDLRVALADERVIIEGRVRTHHAKQLAQHGAMKVLAEHALVNRIVVG